MVSIMTFVRCTSLKRFSIRTVYNLVQNHIRKLDGFPPEVDDLAADAIEHYDEEAPLLSNSIEA